MLLKTKVGYFFFFVDAFIPCRIGAIEPSRCSALWFVTVPLVSVARNRINSGTESHSRLSTVGAPSLESVPIHFPSLMPQLQTKGRAFSWNSPLPISQWGNLFEPKTGTQYTFPCLLLRFKPTLGGTHLNGPTRRPKEIDARLINPSQ